MKNGIPQFNIEDAIEDWILPYIKKVMRNKNILCQRKKQLKK